MPEPSRVGILSQDKLSLIERLELHEELTDDCLEMFRDGHFNEAVRKALERFESRVQDTLDDHNTFGRDLMAKAFTHNKPPIPLNRLRTANDRS